MDPNIQNEKYKKIIAIELTLIWAISYFVIYCLRDALFYYSYVTCLAVLVIDSLLVFGVARFAKKNNVTKGVADNKYVIYSMAAFLILAIISSIIICINYDPSKNMIDATTIPAFLNVGINIFIMAVPFWGLVFGGFFSAVDLFFIVLLVFLLVSINKKSLPPANTTLNN